MKRAGKSNKSRQISHRSAVQTRPSKSPEQSGSVRLKRAKVRHGVRRIFRIQIGPLHVTVHRGDDLGSVRVLESSASPRYFIDQKEVEQATFDRELEQER